MAIFRLVEGPPGQGKSLSMARTVRDLLIRNLKYHAAGGPLRYVYSNTKFTTDFEEFYAPGLRYWSSLEQLTGLRDCDIIWDEIATELDSRNWPLLSEEVRRFLSQYRKRGLDIYSNTQDYSMVDTRARMMITNVVVLRKLFSSPDPSATKPEIKRVWGVVMQRQLLNWRKLAPDAKREYGMPSFWLIRKMDCDVYDTQQDIERTDPPPLRHIEQKCEHFDDPDHECSYCKVVHR
jgi:hypothetical protein